jgi:hypothetical protein
MTEEMKIVVSADSSDAQRKLKMLNEQLKEIKNTSNTENFSSKILAQEESIALRRRQIAEKHELVLQQLHEKYEERRAILRDKALKFEQKRAMMQELTSRQLEERQALRKQHFEEIASYRKIQLAQKVAETERKLQEREISRQIKDIEKLESLKIKSLERESRVKEIALQKELKAKEKALDREAKLKEKSTGKQGGLDFSGIGKKLAGITALYKAGKFVVDSIKESIGAIESESLFQVSFKNMSKDVKDWSDEMSKALSLNAPELRKETATTYDMVRAMNVGKNSAMEMAKGISLMSRDVASLRNEKPEQVYHRFTSALMGMTRGAHLMGYAVTDANVKMYAYSHGIAKTGEELTEQQKVVSRYLLLLEQTKTAHGNLAQTLNSPANQLRMFNENLKTLSQTLGNLFIPLLNAVLPYLNAFLQLITMLIAKIREFFGIKTNEQFAKDLHPGMENLSDDMKELGDGADNFADGLKDSTKQAKKLQKELAKFDEMNVLNEKSVKTPKSPKMGRWQKLMQGYGQPLEFPIPEYDAHLELIKDKVKKIVDEISGYFKGLNYAPLLDSLENLKKSMEPIFADIGQLWQFFVDRILKPITEWTITDLLPAFFDLLSASLQFLAEVIEMLKPPFTWFWDNVLSPIAKWTGGVFVWTLKQISKWLKLISESKEAMEFLKDIVQIVTGLGLALLTVSTAIKAVQLAMAGFQLILGLVTSPIGLVVLAILAIATAIALVIKYLPEIKQWFIDTFNSIKEAVSKVATWFKNTIKRFFEDPIGAVVDSFKWLINTLSGNKWQTPQITQGVQYTIPNMPVPRFAVGGVVSRPTIAQIGENGTEAVVPLERNTGWIDMLASKLTGNGQPINLTVKIGEDNIINRVIDGINNKTVEMGRGMVIV